MAKESAKFKVGQVVMYEQPNGKKRPFLVIDRHFQDESWFYAFNRRNFLDEAMIRALTPEEKGELPASPMRIGRG